MITTRFEQNQKFRVIISEVSFYATATEIRRGVGDTAKPNEAIRKCLNALEFQRSGYAVSGCIDQCATGLNGIWEGFNVQLDLA